MNQPSATRTHHEKQAGLLQTGDHVLLPDGGPAAEIQELEVETDDFGSPALILVTVAGGRALRIAAGSMVLITDTEPATVPIAVIPAAHFGDEEAGDEAAGDAAAVAPALPAPPEAGIPSDEDLARIPAPGDTPESVVASAAQAHSGAAGVQLLSERLTKGINTKSGSCLKDLSDLAHTLFVVLDDAENALAVADLLNVLPFDGNPDRWSSVEASLSLSSFICRQRGLTDRAELYEKFLRAPDAMETDPFKARINTKVLQRSLNEPNLYDKEIFRSIDNANRDAEREWRLLRLESLMFLRAHGGSDTFSADELDERIGNELEAVRA